MPIRLLLGAFLGLSLMAQPALASGAKEKDAKPEAKVSTIDLAPVAVPIIAGGQVKNYIFLTISIVPGEKVEAKELRDKEPMFRDAAVRAAHKTPFTRQDSYNAVDEAWARAQLFKAFAAVAGPGRIKAVEIERQQPKNLVRNPRP